MAKYLVVVNQKYIVKVVAESAGGAEHAILDNIDGIQYAQAFTAKELTTSTFEYYLDTCSTISYAELKQIAADYEATRKDVAAAKEELRKREAELEAAREALDLAQANVDTCKWNLDQTERIAREYEEGLGIKKEN